MSALEGIVLKKSSPTSAPIFRAMLVIAGLFTFMPGRFMHEVMFGS
jgi:uncharacterized membrane protein